MHWINAYANVKGTKAYMYRSEELSPSKPLRGPNKCTFCLPNPQKRKMGSDGQQVKGKDIATFLLRSPTLLPVPHSRDLGMSHLLLQLEDSIHQRFTRRRASRDIDVDGNDTIATAHNRVAIMVISATVRTASH